MMHRFEESQEAELARYITIGEENAACIHGMRQWCSHFYVRRTAAGLYAAMTDLPIASHRISCPKVDSESESMNLTWICAKFLVEHCAGCRHHNPNGDTSWGQNIIDRHLRETERKCREATERADRIARLRSKLREQSRVITKAANPECIALLGFLEAIFDDDENERRHAGERLRQSARLAPDLFPDPAVDLMLALSGSAEFSDLILPVLAELVRGRRDLTRRVEQVALDAIKQGLPPEQCAAPIDAIGDAATYPLEESVVEALLLGQDHYLPIGGWPDGEPTYPYSTALLVRSLDADLESVATVVRRWLKRDDDVARIRLCGALTLLQDRRPEFVLGLAADLMASLAMREASTPGTGTPSGKIVKLLASAFERSPEVVDALLADAMMRVRAAVQEDIVHVYREQFFDRPGNWEDRRDRGKRTEITEHERTAIARLLPWIQDDRIDPGIRWVAAEALEMGCEYAPVGILPRFDELLGYLAIVSENEEPPPRPPRVALPNERIDPRLASLEKLNRQQEWDSFKEKLQQCVEALCKAQPSRLCEHVCACLSDSALQHGAAFYGRCVSLLGELGPEYSLRPRVLPLIMTALMNYGSAGVRARAVNAMVEMFSYSRSAPPTNMIEVVALHLVDQHVAVHRAARHAVSRRPSWFKERTATEALMGLEAQLTAYRQKNLEVKEICEAMLALARCNPELTTRTLDLVESVFPTGEELAEVHAVCVASFWIGSGLEEGTNNHFRLRARHCAHQRGSAGIKGRQRVERHGFVGIGSSGQEGFHFRSRAFDHRLQQRGPTVMLSRSQVGTR